VSVYNSSITAVGRVAAVGVILAAFISGLAGVVYMSLQGQEIRVPEITGKSMSESENEIANLGLKIKKRADRFSDQPANTVLEQLPRPGEVVKSGQMILVVTSKGSSGGDDSPRSLNNSSEDDAEKIEEMLTDKPKKPRATANSNANRKKADTTRDVGDNTRSGESNTNSTPANKKETGASNRADDGEKPPKPAPATPNTRTPGASTTRPSGDPKPAAQPRP
jgi:beta-lactam-binding protein with PASTA domain